MSGRNLLARDGRASAATALFTAAAFVLSAGAVSGAPKVLFSEPLHITREVADPVAGTKTTIDEYCHGNRVVSVGATRTAIVDYDKGTMTAIDFAAGTYSITKFEEIAKANPPEKRTAVAMSAQSEWHVQSRGSGVAASRPAEIIEAAHEAPQLRQTIRLTADRQLTLSRDAIEALLGFAYPNERNASGDVILGALRTQDVYRLPLEQILRVETGGETIEVRNTVVRIGSELPPPEKLLIPPGAKLVESDVVRARRNLEELDRSSTPSNPQ